MRDPAGQLGHRLHFLQLAQLDLHLGALIDLAPFGDDKYNLAMHIPDRHERGIDNDRLLAAGVPIDFRVPADEFALRRALDRRLQDLIDVL